MPQYYLMTLQYVFENIPPKATRTHFRYKCWP